MIIYNKPKQTDGVYINKPSNYICFNDYISKNPLTNLFTCCVDSLCVGGMTSANYENYFVKVCHYICNYNGCHCAHTDQNYNILAAQTNERADICPYHLNCVFFYPFNSLKYDANANFCIRYCLCGWGSSGYAGARMWGNTCVCAFATCSTNFKAYIDLIKTGANLYICNNNGCIGTSNLLYYFTAYGCTCIYPFCIEILSGNVKYIGRTD